MTHSYVFHLTKSERYFAAVDEVREEQKMTGTRYPGTKGVGSDQYAGGAWSSMPDFFYNPLGKLPGSVWSIEDDDCPTSRSAPTRTTANTTKARSAASRLPPTSSGPCGLSPTNAGGS